MRRSSGAVTTIGARMDRTLLLTGFPGFIGTRLATRLLADDPTAQLVALVEPRMVARAREVAAAMEASERIEVVAGDITDSRLGVDGKALLGTTLADLQARFPGVVSDTNEITGPSFDRADDGLAGGLTSLDPTGTVNALRAGNVCID